jgi:ABC-type sugar transport system substrate-binding protein
LTSTPARDVPANKGVPPDMCKFISVIHEQEGKWALTNAYDTMTNWL